MQNTMVRGGGRNGKLGKKIGVREKNEKGEKKEENYIKKWENGLKMHRFGI